MGWAGWEATGITLAFSSPFSPLHTPLPTTLLLLHPQLRLHPFPLSPSLPIPSTLHSRSLHFFRFSIRQPSSAGWRSPTPRSSQVLPTQAAGLCSVSVRSLVSADCQPPLICILQSTGSRRARASGPASNWRRRRLRDRHITIWAGLPVSIWVSHKLLRKLIENPSGT